MARSIIALLLFILVGCEYPKDPEGTLGRIRGGQMRVGVVQNPPWAELKSGEGDGLEAELVKGLAKQLGTTIEWVSGSESDLFEALEKHDLDLVIGGVTEDTPYKKKLGLTYAYHLAKVKIGAPKGQIQRAENLPQEKIATRKDKPFGPDIKKAKGTPVYVDDPSTFKGLVAAYDFEIEAWGMEWSQGDLSKEKHVMAAGPGENAFLMELEKYLRKHEGEIGSMLKQEVRERHGS